MRISTTTSFSDTSHKTRIPDIDIREHSDRLIFYAGSVFFVARGLLLEFH